MADKDKKPATENEKKLLSEMYGDDGIFGTFAGQPTAERPEAAIARVKTPDRKLIN